MVPTSGIVPDILDDVDISVIIHDPETGELLDVNASATELYGYPKATFLELDVGDFSASAADFTQERAVELIRAAAAGEPQTFDWHVKRANGELRWVQVRLRRVSVDGEPYVLAEQRDITAYKEQSRRLRLLYRIIRHNLRNQMNVIEGYSMELQEAIDRADYQAQLSVITETAEEVSAISKSVSGLEQIIDRNAADRAPTELSAVVERVLADVRGDHPDADISFDRPDADIWVRVDEGLDLALRNAIENAVEHTDRERPSITVTIDGGSIADQVRVRIADDGPGIPGIELEALRNEDQISTVSHASGVGLWIIKWCIEALGGELIISANEPRGTVVNCYLPRIETPTASARSGETDQ